MCRAVPGQEHVLECRVVSAIAAKPDPELELVLELERVGRWQRSWLERVTRLGRLYRHDRSDELAWLHYRRALAATKVLEAGLHAVRRLKAAAATRRGAS